jgi:hypothetical protein
MNVYRIKHKPTGMYYAPTKRTTRDGAYLKTNLSKNGKLYLKEPKPEKILGHGYSNPNSAVPKVTKEGWKHFDYNAGWTAFDPKEWEVEKV